jgi:hypothetical protein
VPYPFSTRQYLRLLVLRGRVQDGSSAPTTWCCTEWRRDHHELRDRFQQYAIAYSNRRGVRA